MAETYAFVQLFIWTSSEGPSLLGFNPANEYVSAIFALDDLPEKWHSYIQKNSNYVEAGKFQRDRFRAA